MRPPITCRGTLVGIASFLSSPIELTEAYDLLNGCELSGRGPFLPLLRAKLASQFAAAFSATSPVRSSELLAATPTSLELASVGLHGKA